MPLRKGADYIKALQDGREIWHIGRRIEDVTKHSGFTGTIKTLAGLYDKQHEAEYRCVRSSSIRASVFHTVFFRPAFVREMGG
jgi:aromatic ring hydroxylase